MSELSQKTITPINHSLVEMLSHYLVPQWRRVLITAVILLTAITLQLANPQVIRYFLDTAQSKGSRQALLLAGCLFIGFALLQQGMTLLANYTSYRVSWTATNRLRTDLVLHCLKLDMPFHKMHTPGELIERIDGDVTQLANFFSQFVIRVFGNALLLIGILVLLYRENYLVGLGLTVYTAVTLIGLNFIQKLAAPRWLAERQASAEQYGFIEERISGVEDIRSVGAEPYVMRDFYRLARSFLEKNRAAFVMSSLAYNLTNLVYIIGYTVGLGLGVYLYTRHQASLGTAYLIVYYVGMLSTPLQTIREQAQDLQQSTASIQRIQELRTLQPQVQDETRPHKAHPTSRVVSSPDVSSSNAASSLPAGALAVSFKNVSFHYEDNENVLSQVSFTLPPGKILGILGRTGSGKSTLSRLLFRLYDPADGAIELGGADIRGLPLTILRQRVGIVTQDVQLFQASVRDNLTFFNRSIANADLERVLTDLHLWAWVESLPQGLDTLLAAGNEGLSAGEAQLLAFARVFLKNPDLVILDEASSRLDPATETLMERAVDRLFTGRTGVIIAHRLNTLTRADDILILEDGCTIEYGRRQLLVNDAHSHYAHLIQTGLEEVLR